MMMGLNRVYEGDVLWETGDFQVEKSPDMVGYYIRNKATQVTELFADNEAGAVLQIQSLQESHSEIMVDPEREYTVRKQRQGRGQPTNGAAQKGIIKH